MTATTLPDRLKAYASFVKLEHTVFSLPVLFAAAVLPWRRWPSVSLSGLIIVAAAAGRVMAMGLNRLIDAEIDRRNPRTQQRELPRGAMQRREAWGVVGIAGIVYVSAAAAIAPICLWFSPIPVALFVLYPYLKRFTVLAHVGLGLAWSMAPLGAWLAVSQSLERLGGIRWLWLFSLLWVSGFDIIYATMDEAFDQIEGLHSLPVRVGRTRALQIAGLLHGAALGCLAVLWRTQLHGSASLIWLAAIGALFIWQHAIAARNPAFAFFQLNGVIGFLVLGLVFTGR